MYHTIRDNVALDDFGKRKCGIQSQDMSLLLVHLGRAR
jgi:hypothetical protein